MILLQLDGFCISPYKQHHKYSIHEKAIHTNCAKEQRGSLAQHSGLITLRDQNYFMPIPKL